MSTAALHIDLTITCASSDTVHLTSCSTKKTEIGHALYTSKIIDETWGLGRCWIGDVSFESAAYVARYIVKKVTGERAEAYYVGRKPEYTTMSRRPGIGDAWLKKYADDVYRHDHLVLRGKTMRASRV